MSLSGLTFAGHLKCKYSQMIPGTQNMPITTMQPIKASVFSSNVAGLKIGLRGGMGVGFLSSRLYLSALNNMRKVQDNAHK
jgi:hypothetical protein